MLQCPFCRAGFFTWDGLKTHPCIGFQEKVITNENPIQNRMSKSHT